MVPVKCCCHLAPLLPHTLTDLTLNSRALQSNTWTGEKSFGGRCLHAKSPPGWQGPQCPVNPYAEVIDIMGRTLEDFDDDKLIPAYGFGDASCKDRKCFPFHNNNRSSFRVDEVLQRYDELCYAVTEERILLSGPTSFAPIINEAIRIVAQEQGYHILVIIADGQVSDPKPSGATARAIVLASQVALSIVVVGVGDGDPKPKHHNSQQTRTLTPRPLGYYGRVR